MGLELIYTGAGRERGGECEREREVCLVYFISGENSRDKLDASISVIQNLWMWTNSEILSALIMGLGVFETGVEKGEKRGNGGERERK